MTGKNNLVTFRPDGELLPADVDADAPPYIFLRLEGEFVLSAGLEPNVNRALVPFTEYERLGKAIISPGTIEFWFNKKPGAGNPDHAIKGVRIIDVEPVSIGVVRGLKSDDNLPADVVTDEPRIAELRLYLADMRERMTYPRGGRLLTGKMNPRELKNDSPELLGNRRLVHKCVLAMGLASAAGGNPGLFDERTLPEDLDATPALRELDWNGTPAPEELAKLLKHCRAAFCLRSTGTVGIEMIGKGTKPVIPTGRALPTLKLPGLGRRGKTVIFTSAPSPVIDTIELSGPSSQTWEFVARDAIGVDKNGKEVAAGQAVRFKRTWTNVDEISIFKGFGPLPSVFKDYNDIQFEFRLDMIEEVYRHIRLSKNYMNQRLSPVLRLAVGEGGDLEPPEVMAKIAVREGAPDYLWKNSDQFVRCHAQFMHKDPNSQETIIFVKETLGQVTEPTLFPMQHFLPLRDGDLKVRFSFEASKNGEKEYFRVGFRQVPGDLEKLQPGEIDTLLAKGDPDVVQIAAKELKLRRIDGQDQNRGALETIARGMADKYLAGSGDEYEIVSAVGFVPGELSGNINEIRWDQAGCRTTFKVNGWHYPLSAPPWPTPGGAGQRSFEGQAQTAHEKLAMGEASAMQPAVPILPTATLPGPASASLTVLDCAGAKIVENIRQEKFGAGFSVVKITVDNVETAGIDHKFADSEDITIEQDPLGSQCPPFKWHQVPAETTPVVTDVVAAGDAIVKYFGTINCVSGAVTPAGSGVVIGITDCPDVPAGSMAEALAIGLPPEGIYV